MTVLTVYLCGTGASSFDNNNHNNPVYWQGELVSTLAHNNLDRGICSVVYCRWPR
ncbi:Uncharacterised protein [Proteus mirabilis]|uniref:Uncharacterized protein n=1 Tax=Proteus mirabilis TaxID=584 RepID=A0A379GGM5_PROMI|nr:Uncharacterised protein [Proteus mirabilis]